MRPVPSPVAALALAAALSRLALNAETRPELEEALAKLDG